MVDFCFFFFFSFKAEILGCTVYANLFPTTHDITDRVRLELVIVISPLCISSLDLLPGFIYLDVLVAMARDVEDVPQSVTDSGGNIQSGISVLAPIRFSITI